MKQRLSIATVFVILAGLLAAYPLSQREKQGATPKPSPTSPPQVSTHALRPYPKGTYGSFGGGPSIDPGLVANTGLVGVYVSQDWNVIESAGSGQYNWTSLDGYIAQIKAAGIHNIVVLVTNSSDNTPTWLLNALPADQKIGLLDPASIHNTFCQPIPTALYWNTTFHTARKNLGAAIGAHYNADPDIVAVRVQAFNHNSMDWNIQDTNGNITPDCPAAVCPSITVGTNGVTAKTTNPDGTCTVTVDQPSQWMAAGWTEPQMLQVGKDLIDAYANANPDKNITMPIGGLSDARMSTPTGNTADGNYSQLARDIEAYVYGTVTPPVPPKPYASRFYMQRNTVDAGWGATPWKQFEPSQGGKVPGTNAENYIKYMIWNHAKPAIYGGTTPGQGGLQNVLWATGPDGVSGTVPACRQGSGPTGPCGSTCPPPCVIQNSANAAIGYNVTYYENAPQDARNQALNPIFLSTTQALGGTSRGVKLAEPIGAVRLFAAGESVAGDPVFTNSNADGVRVQMRWRDYEPTEGAYTSNTLPDGNELIRVFNAAKDAHKFVGLSVVAGAFCPPWIYTAPANVYKFTITAPTGGDAFMPLIWDTVYQSKLQNFVNGLAGYLNAAYPGILRYIIVTGIGRDVSMGSWCLTTSEFTAMDNLAKTHPPGYPGLTTDNAAGMGTSAGTYVPAVETITNYFATAFPSVPVILTNAPPYPNAQGSTDQTQIVNDMLGAHPGQFGILNDGHFATCPPHIQFPNWDPYPSGSQAYAASTDIGIYGGATCTRKSPLPLQDLIESITDTGGKFFELWAADINNANPTGGIAANISMLSYQRRRVKFGTPQVADRANIALLARGGPSPTPTATFTPTPTPSASPIGASPTPTATATSTPTPTPTPDTITVYSGEQYGTAIDTHGNTPLLWNAHIHATGVRAAVICIHGGGFRAGKRQDMDDIATDAANAGYNSFSIDYRLVTTTGSPPADFPTQASGDDGRFPKQNDDVSMAILAAKNGTTPHTAGKMNGRVGAIGGSAGGTHAFWFVSAPYKGGDQMQAAIGLSGFYDLHDPATLDSTSTCSSGDAALLYAYVNSTDRSAGGPLDLASPYRRFTAASGAVMFFNTSQETCPISQYNIMLGIAQSIPLIYGGRIVPDTPVQGCTRHASAYWPDVKTEALAWLQAHL